MRVQYNVETGEQSNIPCRVYVLVDGSVQLVDDGDPIPAGAVEASSTASTGPSQQQQEVAAAAAVQEMLDELARSWQYSSYQSARTYRGDINPKFNAEGSALCDFGSACYSLLDDIQAGRIARPSDLAGLLALMPPIPVRPSA